MANVTLKNLVKVYPGDGRNPDFKAVKGIDLEIRDREFMVLVGPSGCAKSTTLRMIAGLEEITDGTIHIGETLVNDVLPKDRDIAMVFQNYALYPHMTLYENMAFGLKIQGMPKETIRKRVDEAAEILGLVGMLERKPKALSGGQRQRVALGRAIVRKPKVFLFDEPLSNLDAKMRVQMRTEISKLHAKLDATMIYVTHDQVEAMTMGDRITVMKLGEIQQVDTPLELYNEPKNKFVAGFIGSPPMNFFDGIIFAEGEDLFFREKATEDGFCIKLDGSVREVGKSAVGKPIVLGVRPESISLVSESEKASQQKIHAKVEVSEPMGAETYLYLGTHHHSFVARVDAISNHAAGHSVDLYFDMNKAHLFDPQTELNLKYPG